ncbi:MULTISPECIES: hypothetical protein [Sphingobacterium]|uniref:hypothetical protein n=1 Tax=Sphingobacterium TaxID=28453 RepID=UPI002579FCE1|nr:MULTISPECIES: hypothetical protein [Sphingobacterium]
MLLSQCLHWGSYYKEAGGYILKHGVGSIPHKTEVDVCLTYVHFFYVETLVRYDRLPLGEKVIKQ